MNSKKSARLKALLEETHREYVLKNEIMNDALAPALKYTEPRDLEFAAFICAILAYGKVSIIKANAEKIFTRLGDQPVDFLIHSKDSEIKKLMKGWVHRLNNSEDMSEMLILLRRIYKSFDGLETFSQANESDFAYTLLERFIDRFGELGVELPKSGSSFWHFLPRPSAGSACKRLNLFLRWMVGSSEMDLKLWSRFSAKNLLIPVDTHILKQARNLGLTKRKSADWKTAEEITESLKLLDPDDPTRFDFALCHLGMNGMYGVAPRVTNS